MVTLANGRIGVKGREAKKVYPKGDLGWSDKTGEGAGQGYNVNFGYDDTHMTDTDYLICFLVALLQIKVKSKAYDTMLC